MIKDIIAHNKEVQPTANIMTKLHADFPQCFNKEGKFDIEKFRNLIKTNIDVTEEGYDLNFLGKNYANLIASTETETVIQPDIEQNGKPENCDSHNIYISGDNLDALKHLLKSYAGKIKCIYIDPPYNTGSDGFVYNDRFNFTIEELQNKLSISEEKAKRILDLCRRGSASHSAWLMFMAPRLMLAKDLLTNDGVIFISIDDNEQANLKLLCDNVFGEENKLGVLPTIMNLKGNNDEYAFAGTHEYTIVYAKNKETSTVGEFDVNSDSLVKWFEDEIGMYKKGATLKRTGNDAPRNHRQHGYFPILVNKISKEIRTISVEEYLRIYDKKSDYFDDNFVETLREKYINEGYYFILPESDGVKTSWRWGYDTVSKDKDEILVCGDGDDISLYKKQRPSLGDLPTAKPKSTFYKPQYSSGNGTAELKELFGFKPFDNPKPTELIYDFLQIGANKDECYIIDFFSGSASTAESVMRYSINKDRNLKYIMVQLQEPTKADREARKAGYETIDQIGMERIRRAAVKIKNELNDEIADRETKLAAKEAKLAKENVQKNMFDDENPLEQEIEILKTEIETKRHQLETADFGFKHYTLRDVPQNTLDKMETFDAQAVIADTDLVKEFGKETVLETWCVNDGYGFGADVRSLQLANYTAYHCGSHLYFVEGDGFDEKAIIALVDRYGQDAEFNPQNIVLFGYSFNFTQTEMIKKNLATVKKINGEINLDIRY